MASLMIPAQPCPPASLLRIHRRRVGWYCLLIITTGMFHIAGHAEEPVVTQTSTQQPISWDWTLLDWKTLDQLSPAQRAAVPIACCGAFIQPENMQPVHGTTTTGSKSHSPLQDNEDISITGANSQMTKQSTVMTGDVMLIQGQRRISGDHAELFNEPQGVHLEGNVLFREPGFLLQGSDANIDLEKNTLQIENARYVLHEQRIHGEAAQIQRDAQGVITLTDSTYSSCTPGDELWFLKSSSMTLDPANGQGKATNVRIEVFDTPVFYFPYLLFPVGDQRHSGFLAPSLSTGQNGLDISLPYYLNLAPNYDATLIPRFMADRGSQLGSEFRYMGSSFTSSALATWLPDDQQLHEDRWLFGLKEDGGQYHPWHTLVNITRVSDDNYFNDLDNSGLSISRTTDLQQRGKAGYMTDHWDTGIEVLEYQSLQPSSTDPYHKLPQISATGNYILGDGFSTRLSQSVTRFDSSNQSVTGDRLSADYRLDWHSNWQAGYIVPAVEMHYLEQQLNNSTTDSNPRVTIPGANLDMGLVFVHDGAQYQQTLEPRLFYNYNAYKNQDNFQLFDTDEMSFAYSQIFRDIRFSGNDRIGDANQTSLGLTSRWLDKTNGSEWLHMGIGQIFYHENREITAYDPATFASLPQDVQDQYTNHRSPIAGSLQWSMNSLWRLNTELAWDDAQHQTNSGSVFLHYQSPAGELVSIGYREAQLLDWTGTSYVQETTRQSDLSSYWPMTNQWALIGRANYDFTNDRFLEKLAGLQYEDCCWKLRAVFRQWAANPDKAFPPPQQPSEQGIYLEIQFKNLVGVGTQTSSMLKDSIYGYDTGSYEKNE